MGSPRGTPRLARRAPGQPANALVEILSTWTMRTPCGRRILQCMINPLAIGVTLGGLLLDALVPRPKPRVGPVLSPMTHRLEDTVQVAHEGYERPLVASG